MVVISLGEPDETPEQHYIDLDGPVVAPPPNGQTAGNGVESFVVELDEDPAPMQLESSARPELQVSISPPEPAERESTAASKLEREGTTASRVSHLSREEIIEELEAVETRLKDTEQEKETWRSKCHQTETQFETLKREATEEMENLKVQTSQELTTWKNQYQRAEGELLGIKKQLTPQKLGMAADEFEAFLHGPEPTKAERKVGRCITNRKFIIIMLYTNIVCGAVYLYVFAVHQATDEDFQPRPEWLFAMDWAFLTIFVLAMLLRLLVFRLNLRGFWTVFEFALLPLFIIEQALSANSDSLIEEMTMPRNTLQGLRILFVVKLVPVLARELKAWRSKLMSSESDVERQEQPPVHVPL